MSICVETQGCFELDPDSGEPNANCVFTKLSQARYACASLASVDERDVPSLEQCYRLVYPARVQQVINKTKSDCLRLATIVQKCKFKISANVAHNVINVEDKKRIRRVLHTWGNFGVWGMSRGNTPHIHKPNGRLWKRVSGQVASKSLAWIPRGGILQYVRIRRKKRVGLSRG